MDIRAKPKTVLLCKIEKPTERRDLWKQRL